MATKTLALPDSTQLITADDDHLRWAVLAAPVPAAQLLANAKTKIDAATSAVEALEQQQLRTPTVRFADEIPSEHPDIPTLILALLGDTEASDRRHERSGEWGRLRCRTVLLSDATHLAGDELEAVVVRLEHRKHSAVGFVLHSPMLSGVRGGAKGDQKDRRPETTKP